MPETLRCNDAEFGHVSAQCIDQHRGCRTRRLRARCSINTDCCSAPFTGTNRIEGPGYCLADRFRNGGIVSCCARLGLHIGRWHQLPRMPKCCQLTCPMMRCRAGFHADYTRLR